MLAALKLFHMTAGSHHFSTGGEGEEPGGERLGGEGSGGERRGRDGRGGAGRSEEGSGGEGRERGI